MQIIKPKKEQFIYIHRIGKRSCNLTQLRFSVYPSLLYIKLLKTSYPDHLTETF